jgi:hypothetical protein
LKLLDCRQRSVRPTRRARWGPARMYLLGDGNQTVDSRVPFSSPPRKRGSRAATAGSAALDARFRGHDGEEAWAPNVRKPPAAVSVMVITRPIRSASRSHCTMQRGANAATELSRKTTVRLGRRLRARLRCISRSLQRLSAALDPLSSARFDRPQRRVMPLSGRCCDRTPAARISCC